MLEWSSSHLLIYNVSLTLLTWGYILVQVYNIGIINHLMIFLYLIWCTEIMARRINRWYVIKYTNIFINIKKEKRTSPSPEIEMISHRESLIARNYKAQRPRPSPDRALKKWTSGEKLAPATRNRAHKTRRLSTPWVPASGPFPSHPGLPFERRLEGSGGVLLFRRWGAGLALLRILLLWTNVYLSLL